MVVDRLKVKWLLCVVESFLLPKNKGEINRNKNEQ